MKRWLATYDRNERARLIMFFFGLWLILLLVAGWQWWGLGIWLVLAGWWRITVDWCRVTHDDPIEEFRQYIQTIHICGPDCQEHNGDDR